MEHARLALSIAEFARQTGTSTGFVRKEIRSGKLAASKRGRRVLVPLDSARAWLQSGMLAATSPTETSATPTSDTRRVRAKTD